jgi:TetR/AcrR family transcriptional regulator, fatty acid biosynthesis regulator
MEIPFMSPGVAKLSRREAKALSRQRLIDATIEILVGEGPGALTTGRVARAAGLSQPSFYVHFRDMDEALEVAAQTIGERIRQTLVEARRRLKTDRSRSALSEAFGVALDAFLSQPVCTQVLLRYRRDETTPVGRYAQALLETLRGDLVADCRAMGLDAARAPGLELFAEYTMAMTLSTVEGILDGRLSDRARCLDALVRSSVAVYGALQSWPGGTPHSR